MNKKILKEENAKAHEKMLMCQKAYEKILCH